jgi:hypothetical protein
MAGDRWLVRIAFASGNAEAFYKLIELWRKLAIALKHQFALFAEVRSAI